jgi:ribonuclease E
MSDMSTPAGNSGGDTTAPVAAALAELPARIRVHALAKLLGRSSREVLAAVTDLGADGRSVQSSIDRELALRVAESLGVTVPGSDVTNSDPDAESAGQSNAAGVPQSGSAQSAGAGAAQSAGAPQAPGFRQTAGATPPPSSRQASGAPGSPGFTSPSRGHSTPAPDPESPARVIPPTPVFASASPLFLPPERPVAPTRPAPKPKEEPEPVVEDETDEVDETDEAADADDSDDNDEGRPRRRRGRRGRGRGKGGQDDATGEEAAEDEPKADKPEKPEKPEKADKPARRGRAAKEEPEADDADEQESADGDDPASRRRRRRRRRRGGDAEEGTGNSPEDDPPNTVVHVRDVREAREAREVREEKPESDGRDEVRSVRGSTRLEAKRQRRRDGREAGRRRAPILSEAEFLARREAVDRAMVIRERADRIQIGVLEDGVLVEHFVTSAGTGSLVGNVYLGRVQNVLPSMEAAFVDIGRGRNAVLYAGEVDWDAAGLEGKARKIEQALSTGDSVLVQVTKDPVGHKGARLTTQISLPGRFLVYVPGGGATGISRKLPENERRRLKDVLKRVVPEDAGVIIRTASEGISEEELARDVRRLQAQWQVIRDRTEGTNGVRRVGSPSLVYEEPDLLVKVVRDLFTEDFSALVIQGDIAWETVNDYVSHVAPELADRLRKHVGGNDVFAEYRIDEQLLKALDRKVWLPSGGYLVIDRTEAMTVIDVNTGKFTGSGGNLEETVTRNNLESAEEIVRQLRLRDIGGIIVIDFIDMVLESNRDLVLRRLTECLGRDRTRHQVAEVTSLGLVQMTRKRVGTGLLEAFGTTCEHCKGRGVLVSTDPMSKPNGTNGASGNTEPTRGNTRRSRGRADEGKDLKDKPTNKDAAKEAAAQAAKDAVRDIAKATTKATTDPTTQEPQPAPEPQQASESRSASESQPAASGSRPVASEPRAAASESQRVASESRTASGFQAAASDPDALAAEPSAEGATRRGEPARGRHRTRERSRRGEARNGTSANQPSDGSTDAPAESEATTPQPAEPTAERTEHAEPSQPTGHPQEHTNGSVSRSESPTQRSESTGLTEVSEPTEASEPAGSGTATGASEPAGSGTATGASEPAWSGAATGVSESAGSGTATGASESARSGESTGASESTGAGEQAGAGVSIGSGETAEFVSAGAGGSAAASSEATGPGEAAGSAAPAASGVPAESPRSEPSPAWSPYATAEPSDEPSDASDASDDSDDAPSVPAPAIPPRRQPRRAASRPAGPPVSARHDG